LKFGTLKADHYRQIKETNMATVIYEIPDSVKEMFEQGENSYRIIDYSINEMDNNQSMQYFLDCIGASENIDIDDGTQVVVKHPDFDHKLVIDSGGCCSKMKTKRNFHLKILVKQQAWNGYTQNGKFQMTAA